MDHTFSFAACASYFRSNLLKKQRNNWELHVCNPVPDGVLTEPVLSTGTHWRAPHSSTRTSITTRLPSRSTATGCTTTAWGATIWSCYTNLPSCCCSHLWCTPVPRTTTSDLTSDTKKNKKTVCISVAPFPFYIYRYININKYIQSALQCYTRPSHADSKRAPCRRQVAHRQAFRASVGLHDYR